MKLRLDENDVTETLRVKKCLQKTIDTLDPKLQKMLVCLSVFQTSPISFHDACAILHSKKKLSHKSVPEETLVELHRYHLIEIERDIRSIAPDTEEKRNISFVSLHPLVYKYIVEWNPQEFKRAVDKAYKSFAMTIENIINRIGKYLSTDCYKGLRKLEEYKTHIMKYYHHMYKDPWILPSYKVDKLTLKVVLQKLRIRELTDILFSNDRKRASFESEARRAHSDGNMEMFRFWMVEVADVYVAQDRPEFALDCLRTLEDKYPYFRKFENRVMYTRLVHVRFHMVKGQSLARLEIPRLEDSYKHFELAKSFCNGFQPRKDYRHLCSKITKEMGDICYKTNDLNSAEEYYLEAERMLLKPTYLDNPHPASLNDSVTLIEYHLDKSIFFNCRALIHFQRGLIASTEDERKRVFDMAVTTLGEGMTLDVALKLDERDGFAQKLKNRADVYIQMGLLNEALRDAKEAMDMRRGILRPPHSFMTESVFQVAILYDLIGNTELQKKNDKCAMGYWKTSTCYFDELVEHHFKMGSISKQNILYRDIKQKHLQLLRNRNAMEELRNTETFYKDFENGKYSKDADSGRRILMHQTMPPSEILEECFKKGKTFLQAPEPMEGMEEQDPDDPGLGREIRHSSVGSEEESLESSVETTVVTDSMLKRLLQQSVSPLGDKSQPPRAKNNLRLKKNEKLYNLRKSKQEKSQQVEKLENSI